MTKAAKGKFFDAEANQAIDACVEHLKTSGHPIDEKRLKDAKTALEKALEISHPPAARG